MISAVILIWISLIALELRVTRRNINNWATGYGSMAATLERNSKAPMRYRVLAAWTVGRLPLRYWPGGYMSLKYLLMGAALFIAYPLLGLAGVAVLAVLTASTFEYDYWDCYAELAAVGLILYGEPWAVLTGAVLWGLSKETVFLAPALALFAGGLHCGLIGLAGPLMFLLAMVIQGKAKLYCKRWTARVYNAADLRIAWAVKDSGMLLSLTWMIAAVLVALFGKLAHPFAGTAWLGLGWFVAGWTLARARETRVFLPAALWIASGVT